jgi:hypothetical protein
MRRERSTRSVATPGQSSPRRATPRALLGWVVDVFRGAPC